MQTTPPVPSKRGAAPLIVATLLAAGSFVLIPIVQFIEPRPEPKEPPLISTPDIPIPPAYIPPPKEEQPPEKPEEIEIKTPPPEIVFDQIDTGGTGAFIPTIENNISDLFNIGDIVDMASLDAPPEATFQASPRVNRLERRGEVRVMLVVDTMGRVVSADLMTRLTPEIDRASLDAARKWRFKPGYLNGQPVKFRIVIPFVYNR